MVRRHAYGAHTGGAGADLGLFAGGGSQSVVVIYLRTGGGGGGATHVSFYLRKG